MNQNKNLFLIIKYDFLIYFFSIKEKRIIYIYIYKVYKVVIKYIKYISI